MRRRTERKLATVHELRPPAFRRGPDSQIAARPAGTVIDLARARARRTLPTFDRPPEGTAA